MLKNYLLIALRNFWRHKTFSLINILGLAIGISASMVIFLLVHFDLSFDKFEPHGDRIYRVVAQVKGLGESTPRGENCFPVPMGAAIKKEVTGIDQVVRIHTWDGNKITVSYPNARASRILKDQHDVASVDGDYFDMLGYTWLYGSPATSASQPYQVVLTEKNARLYYPNMDYGDIIGKPLTIDDTIQTTVAGIVKDLPGSSDFYFGTFVSRVTLETARLRPDNWDSWNNINSADQIFVRLTAGTKPAVLSPLLTHVSYKYRDPKDEAENKVQLLLQPLSDLHFDTDYGGFDEGRTAHKPTLYGLIAVASFLLLLACINFINLTTAQSAARAREIGIRKTMGGHKRQLAFQFLSETFVLTLIATVLSIALTPLLLEVFHDFIPKDFHYTLFQPAVLVFLPALIIAVTLFSGFYPALVMSAFNPILALKNQTRGKTNTTRSAWLRRSLTVSQFVIAQVFIIATILVGKQISYALNIDMGFRKDAIIYVRTNYREPAIKKNTFVAQLKMLPGIRQISVASDPPSSNSTWTSTITYNNGKNDIVTNVQIKIADSNYFRLFRLRLLAGTGVPESDTMNAVVISEGYAQTLGFRDPRKALGIKLKWSGNPVIVGVAADFHPHSIHRRMNPILIANGTDQARTINILLQPSHGDPNAWPNTIARIEKAYKQIYPNYDFTYKFVDETIAGYYKQEKDVARLLTWATGLAIFISCLGLLGLVIYITNQRTKEIGIRKVIGATVSQIIFLLSKDFLTLIGLAIVIAMPVAWWGSHRWLDNFAYRTDLSWWVFAAGGAILLLIALIVLCARAFQAARVNPVESLRSE